MQLFDEEMVAKFHEEFPPEVLAFCSICLAFYVVIWTILIKSKVFLRGDKKVKKAVEEGRTIKATLEPCQSLRIDNDYFRYQYVDLKGRNKIFVAKMLGGVPSDELTLYYNERGKVFSERDANRPVIFWYLVAFILPGVLALAFCNLTGIATLK